MLKNLQQKIFNLPGSWLIIIGAVLWSTSGAVVKSFDTDPVFVAGLRSLIAGLVLAPAIRPKKIKFDRWVILYIIGFAGLVVGVIPAFRMTSATVVIGMQYTAPVWIFIASAIISKKPQMDRLPIILLIIIAMAIFLIEPVSGTAFWGNWLAVVLGICFAVLSYALSRIEHDNALGLVAVVNLGAALIIMPICYALPAIDTYVAPSEWPYLIYLALFQLSAGYFFYSLGMKKVPAQRATLLAVWEFILTPVWALLIVQELPSFYILSGAILLLIALVLDAKLAQKKSSVIVPPAI